MRWRRRSGSCRCCATSPTGVPVPERPRRAATTSSSAPTRSTRPASPRCSRRSTTSPSGRASTRGCSSAPRSGSTAAARAARCSAASDLREAEAWLAEQAAHKEPQPTPLQTEYILASRTAATRRQWIACRGGSSPGSRSSRSRSSPCCSAVTPSATASSRRESRSRDSSPRRLISQLADRPRAQRPARRAGRFGEPDGRGRAIAAPGALDLARRGSPCAGTGRGSGTRRSAPTGRAS